MVVLQKSPYFQFFFLGNIGQENVFCVILERKNPFLGYKIRKFIKSKNWHIPKGVNPWFWSKNGHFSRIFLDNICQENVFYDILERKDAFLGYKNKKSKKSKIWHFSKGLTHGFGPKMAIFPSFFLGNIGNENFFYDILERKNAFLGYKNNKTKKSQNWHFSKVVNHWFWFKTCFFSNFFI